MEYLIILIIALSIMMGLYMALSQEYYIIKYWWPLFVLLALVLFWISISAVNIEKHDAYIKNITDDSGKWSIVTWVENGVPKVKKCNFFEEDAKLVVVIKSIKGLGADLFQTSTIELVKP